VNCTKCSGRYAEPLAQGNHVTPNSGGTRWDSRAFLDPTGGAAPDFQDKCEAKADLGEEGRRFASAKTGETWLLLTLCKRNLFR